MAEARITEFFGESQIQEEVLDFMGLGSCMPREAWRLPSPQNASLSLEQRLCAHLGAHRYLQSEPRTTSFRQSNGFSRVHWRVHSNKFASVSLEILF